MSISDLVGQAAVLGGTAFVGAVGNDLLGRQLEVVHQIPKAIRSQPVGERTYYKGVHIGCTFLANVQDCFFRERTATESKNGSVLLGSVTALGMGVGIFGLDYCASLSALGVTLCVLGTDSIGGYLRRSVALTSDAVSKKTIKLYSQACKLVDKEAFNETILGSQRTLAKLGFHSSNQISSPDLGDLNKAKSKTEKQLHILTSKLGLGLTIKLLHEYVLGAEAYLTVIEKIEKERAQDGFFRDAIKEDRTLRDSDLKIVFEKLDFRERERVLILQNENRDIRLREATLKTDLISQDQKNSIYSEIDSREKKRNEALRNQELNAILLEMSVSDKKGISTDFVTVYLKRNASKLNISQTLSIRIWFFVAKGFISDLVDNFAVNALNEFREKLLSTDGESQEDFVIKLMNRLIALFNSKSLEAPSGEDLRGSCDALIDTIVAKSLPDLIYFKKYHELIFVGEFFKLLDQVILNALNYFFRFEEAVSDACKRGISEAVFELISDVLKPENIRPKLVLGLNKMVESVKTTEVLEEPLSNEPKIVAMHDLIEECLHKIYDWLKIPTTIPSLVNDELKDKIVKISTEQVFKALSQYGAPIEVEGYLLKILKSANTEIVPLSNPVLSEEEFHQQISHSMANLEKAAVHMLVYGDPEAIEDLCKRAREKQRDLIKEYLEKLKEIRNRRESLSDRSDELLIESLKEEGVAFEKFFKEARSFSLKISNSLPENYQQTLRQNFMPIYKNMKEQVDVLADFLDHLEGKGLERIKSHEIIRNLLSDRTIVKVGASFRSSLSTPVRIVCRKDNAEEERLSVNVNMNEADMDLHRDGIALKTSILRMVRNQRLEHVADKSRLEKEQESLFIKAIELEKKLHISVIEGHNMKGVSLLSQIPSGVVENTANYGVQFLLNSAEGATLQKKVSDFYFREESHVELVSILLNSVREKVSV